MARLALAKLWAVVTRYPDDSSKAFSRIPVALTIAGSDSSLPFFEDLQRQGRAIAAVGAIGGGIAAAGILSGLGAILRLMLTDRLEREGLGPAPPEQIDPGAPEQ